VDLGAVAPVHIGAVEAEVAMTPASRAGALWEGVHQVARVVEEVELAGPGRVITGGDPDVVPIETEADVV
jgi:hypothetical protein